MGNCMNVSMKESSTIWGVEEWGSPSPVPGEATETESEFSSGTGPGQKNTYYMSRSLNAKRTEEEENMMEKKKGTSFHSTITGTEVKIKITKKQLEEILGKVDARGLSLEQVLTQLISLSADAENIEARPRSWRPVLHSIPEAEVY